MSQVHYDLLTATSLPATRDALFQELAQHPEIILPESNLDRIPTPWDWDRDENTTNQENSLVEASDAIQWTLIDGAAVKLQNGQAEGIGNIEAQIPSSQSLEQTLSSLRILTESPNPIAGYLALQTLLTMLREELITDHNGGRLQLERFTLEPQQINQIAAFVSEVIDTEFNHDEKWRSTYLMAGIPIFATLARIAKNKSETVEEYRDCLTSNEANMSEMFQRLLEIGEPQEYIFKQVIQTLRESIISNPEAIQLISYTNNHLNPSHLGYIFLNEMNWQTAKTTGWKKILTPLRYSEDYIDAIASRIERVTKVYGDRYVDVSLRKFQHLVYMAQNWQ